MNIKKKRNFNKNVKKTSFSIYNFKYIISCNISFSC